MAYYNLFTTLVFLSLLCSCGSDVPKPESRSTQIAGTSEFGKTYQIESIEVELGELVPNSCISDNFITYYPNGQYELREGATKCDPSDPPAVVGTWELRNNDIVLFIDLEDSTQTWNIETLNDEEHRISSQFEEGLRVYTLFSSN